LPDKEIKSYDYSGSGSLNLPTATSWKCTVSALDKNEAYYKDMQKASLKGVSLICARGLTAAIISPDNFQDGQVETGAIALVDGKKSTHIDYTCR
jgi:hypothetical protein